LEEIRLMVAGTAAGTSIDLAKLGADVHAMGALGLDELGNFIVTTMQRYGIHTEGLVRKSSTGSRWAASSSMPGKRAL
jgi:sugar/nucleoside kinase (ribokinase family)